MRKQSLQTEAQLKRKADRALQDNYRATYKGIKKCESCGKVWGSDEDVVHHFIEKSLSSALRYEPINLIFLCKRCHFLHHNVGESSVIANVILGRGEEWLKLIQKKRREPVHLNKTYLREQIEKYK